MEIKHTKGVEIASEMLMCVAPFDKRYHRDLKHTQSKIAGHGSQFLLRKQGYILSLMQEIVLINPDDVTSKQDTKGKSKTFPKQRRVS